MANITAGRGALNMRDFLRGLLIAVITGPLTVIGSSIDAGHLTFNWKLIGGVALFSGLSYLIKNISTPSQVVITDKETVQAAKDGETITVTPKPQN